MKRMIFHLPEKLHDEPVSGSSLRPKKLIEAFKSIGYHVEDITGSHKERAKKIRRVKDSILRGVKYEFLYSESSNLPLPLSDPKHIPFYPIYDYIFFKWLKTKGIPIGIFYRDIHWRFDIYKRRFPFIKRILSYPFYYYDLYQYAKLADVLFLPTRRMADYLPHTLRFMRILDIPPGTQLYETAEKVYNKPLSELHLIYVGGITPPLYDLTPLFNAIGWLKQYSNKKIYLTVCSREKELGKLKKYYPQIILDTLPVSLLSCNNDKLKKVYEEADVVSLFLKFHPYYQVAAPVKLYEAIGFSKPVLTIKDTFMADFVTQNNIGWVIKDNIEEFVKWANHIFNDPGELLEKIENVRKIKAMHTWERRAYKIADFFSTLLAY